MAESEQEDVRRYAGGIIRRMLKEGQAVDLKKVKDIVKRKMGTELSDSDLTDIKSRMTKNQGTTATASPEVPAPSPGKSSPIETLAAYLNKKKADAMIIYASGKYSIWRKADSD